MALQSTVTQFEAPGARGLIANAETRNVFSRTLVGAAALFGVPVYRSPASEKSCTIDNTAGAFLGLTRRSGTINPVNAPVDSYNAGDEVPVMPLGVMWVQVANAVTAGNKANYDTAAQLFTSAAVAGSVIAVPGCEFDSTTAAAGLAKVRVFRVNP